MFYFLMLGFFVIISTMCKKNAHKIIVTLSYFILLLFASFRFGIGIDYFNFHAFYIFAPSLSSGDVLNSIHAHQFEPVFIFLMMIFRHFNLPFTAFIAFCAFVSLSLIFYTIQKYSSNRTMSLLAFFACYYMIYIESALRQGLAMAIFIYAFYSFLHRGKLIKYYLLIILGMTMHTSLVIAFFIPILIKINNEFFFNLRNIIFMIAISFALIPIMPILLMQIDSLLFNGRNYSYFIDTNFFIMAILYRLTMLAFSVFLYIKSKDNLSEIELKCLKVYIGGILIYFSFSPMAILSRLTEYLMFIDIIFIPSILIHFSLKQRRVFKAALVCIFIILFTNDIESFVQNRRYIGLNNVFDYRYITIFNKEDKYDMLRCNIAINRYFRHERRRN